MGTVVNCFHVGKYAILVVDHLPERFDRVIISGKEYKVLLPYDLPNAIAIESNEDFSSASVEYI